MVVAYDNSTSQTIVGSGTTSFSYTCSGTNRFLIVVTGVKITAITYNGVSMTKYVDFEPSIHDGNQVIVRVWTLANPASGSNTLATTISFSDNEGLSVASYSGVYGSNPETYNTSFSNNGSNNTQVTDLSATVTTISNNAWSVMCTMGANALKTFTASTGTLRTTGTSILSLSHAIIDSNSVISPAGDSTLNATWSSGSGFISNVIISLKPSFESKGTFMPYFI